MNIAVQNLVVLKHRQESAGVSACLTCSRKPLCPVNFAPVSGRESGSMPVQKIIQSGKAVYDAGDQFDGIYIVRSGFLKSYAIDADGVMQVTGFHLPGEFFGMDGLENSHYSDHVEALDTSSVCRLPLALFTNPGSEVSSAKAGLAVRHDSGNMMLELVKLMSRTISSDRNMFFTLGKMSARRRFGTFLQDLSERMEKSGYSGTEFILCMSRSDIANYLCLALETISRLFSLLHAEGIITVERRNLKILDMAALTHDETKPEKNRKAG